ncbi:MAG TPA: hypothetical protein VGM50_21915, partial [Gemmatimonadaceae bacterium]
MPILALLLASQAPDWIQLFSSVIIGSEHAQLWSHSIHAVVIGATVVGSCACFYNHPPLDWTIECAVLLAGWLVYRTAAVDDTTSSAKRKRLAFQLLIGLVLCQTGVDRWQSFRIFRAPDVAACTEAAARAPRPTDSRFVSLARRSEPRSLRHGW